MWPFASRERIRAEMRRDDLLDQAQAALQKLNVILDRFMHGTGSAAGAGGGGSMVQGLLAAASAAGTAIQSAQAAKQAAKDKVAA